jgi:hypothetical protein
VQGGRDEQLDEWTTNEGPQNKKNQMREGKKGLKRVNRTKDEGVTAA